MVELVGGRILVQLETASNVTKVVVFKFEEARQHISHVRLNVLRLGGVSADVCCHLVRSSVERLLLDDASRVVEGAAGDEALLAGWALDVEDEAISGELLA